MEIKTGERYWLVGYVPPELEIHNGIFYSVFECVAKIDGSLIKFTPIPDAEGLLIEMDETLHKADIDKLEEGKGGRCGWGFWCIAKTKEEAENGFTSAVFESIKIQTRYYNRLKAATINAMGTLTSLMNIKTE